MKYWCAKNIYNFSMCAPQDTSKIYFSQLSLVKWSRLVSRGGRRRSHRRAIVQTPNCFSYLVQVFLGSEITTAGGETEQSRRDCHKGLLGWGGRQQQKKRNNDGTRACGPESIKRTWWCHAILPSLLGFGVGSTEKISHIPKRYDVAATAAAWTVSEH